MTCEEDTPKPADKKRRLSLFWRAVLISVAVLGLLLGLAVWKLVQVKTVAVTLKGYVPIYGTKFGIVTEESLADLGCQRERMPPKDNASPLYFQAFGLMAPEPRSKAFDNAYKQALKGNWAENAKELTPWLDANSKAISKTFKAIRRPRCQFPVLVGGDGKWRGWSSRYLPFLARMRSLARLMMIQGVRLEHDGKPAQAARHYQACGVLARHVADGEPSRLISSLVGVAVHTMASDRTARLLQRDMLSEEDLARLAKALEASGGDLPDYGRAINAERDLTLRVLDDLAEGVVSMDSVVFRASGVDFVDQALLILRKAELRLSRKKVRREINALFDYTLALQKQPVKNALSPSTEARYWKRTESASFFTRQLAFPVLRIRLQFLSAEAQQSGLRIMTALMLHRKRHGRFPPKLAALVPEEIDKLPPDPFSEKDFVYVLSKDGEFTLYSLGRDLDDDGGKPETPDKTDGDIVFHSQPQQKSSE